ncbi:lytic transglycosylase domain-containing protein, partial [Thermodesulfobacteriota bacterium]
MLCNHSHFAGPLKRCFIISALLFITLFLSLVEVSSAKVKPIILPHELHFCGDLIEITPEMKERLEVRYYGYMRNETQLTLWMKRSRKFFPIIEKKLAENDMPDDLKYLAIVESALMQRSYSSKGAVGVWQFVRDTGKRRGLKIQKGRYDERRDVYRATDAAIRYFKFLYEKFGNWPLAMAAYNIGENRIAREVKEQESSNYFEMLFPRETDEYVINVMIVKYIMEHPKRFKIALKEDEYFEPLRFSTVSVSVDSHKTPFSLVAKASDATMREIKVLNPQIIGNFLYKGVHELRVPPEGRDRFDGRYADLIEEYEKNNTYVKVIEPKAAIRTG